MTPAATHRDRKLLLTSYLLNHFCTLTPVHESHFVLLSRERIENLAYLCSSKSKVSTLSVAQWVKASSAFCLKVVTNLMDAFTPSILNCIFAIRWHQITA